MEDAMSNPFRERITDLEAGLKTEKGVRSKLPSAAGLKIDTSLDISALNNFTAPSVEIRGVAERIKPHGMGDLRIEADLGKLDEGLEKIKRQQIDEKIRALVEEAERLIVQKKYRPAIRPLDLALEIDPSSTQALFLKGYSLFSLEAYNDALDVLDEARRFARDAETTVTILMLQAACIQAATELVEGRIAELIEKGRYREALDLLDDELRHQPSNIAFLYHRCVVLVLMGKVGEARRAAIDARGVVGGENAELFDELLAQITFSENAKYIEAARMALRRGDANEAVGQLDRCRVLAGNEQYDAVRSYAEDRLPRGFLSSIFSRSKSASLAEPTLQKLLMWLLAEEVDDGVISLNEGRFKQAYSSFEKAAKIDDRCKIVCFLQGVAIYNEFEDSLKRQELPDLGLAIRSLEKASSLLRRAGSYQVVAYQSLSFLKAVDDSISQLNEIAAERARIETEDRPINELIGEFNSLMDSLERAPAGSMREIESAEKKFRAIREKAEKIRKRGVRKEAQNILDQIIAAADRNLKQAGEVLRDFSKNKAVNDCVTAFTVMMDYFSNHPISSYQELQMARDMVKALKANVAKARHGQRRGSEAWQVLDQVEEAIRRVESQLH
jgi:tetratricopeptide (TPR) repeat protein